MAQAGVEDPTKLEEAVKAGLDVVKRLLEEAAE